MKQLALITGAASGIGQETARLLHRDGFQVIIHYNKSEQAAAQLAQELDAPKIKADIADPQQVSDMFAKIEETYGEVSLLVNNAAISQQGLFQETTLESWRWVFSVNMEGLMSCCQRAVPGMIRRKAGTIINLSSIWGLMGASCETAYSASKAAVVGFTKALAKELAPSGIRVNCVAPGVITTPMNAAHSESVMQALAEETPLGRLGTPIEIAETIAFLASNRAAFITGQIISPNGGFLI